MEGFDDSRFIARISTNATKCIIYWAKTTILYVVCLCNRTTGNVC